MVRSQMLRFAILLGCVAGASVNSVSAYAVMPADNAERMDISTHDFLIDKLVEVIEQTPVGDATRIPSLLRLADLFSERSRLLMLKEVEANCLNDEKAQKQSPVCGSSSKDRRNAIQYYELALKESSKANQSRILFQLAYLYESELQNRKAESMYRRILSIGKTQFSQAVLGQSQMGLAEIAFREKKFQNALRDYHLALKNPETPRKGWIHYRMAWCELNTARAASGKNRLLMILKNPNFLVLESSVGSPNGAIDRSFQEDVARDLTVFYAKTGYTQADIEELWKLSPESARKDILISLADESERLGQRISAIEVWKVLSTRSIGLSNREKIEASISLSNLYYGLGQKVNSVSSYQHAVELWKKGGCDPLAECELLQKRFRKLVLDWNKNEETKISSNLLNMYQAYVSLFPKDIDMAFWGGSVAKALGPKYRADAISLYMIAAEESARVMTSTPQNKWQKNLSNVFEASLLTEIEMAEETHSVQIREKAYRHYLTLNPNGKKALEVRYQIAHLAYEQKDVSKAADLFFELAARDENCRSKVAPTFCKQAADLALDSVVLLKNDLRLESMAEEFSKLYPSKSADYLTVARRARLNISAKAAGSNQKTEMNENLAKLKMLDLRGASHSETVLTYQNRFVLAEKLKNFDEANAAAIAIINFKGASPHEREDAMAKRLWVAEMRLDFPTAYVTARQMKHAGLSPEERELRLALLAELAGRDARSHLKAYISFASKTAGSRSRNRKAILAARANLVKLSGYSVAEFRRQLSELKSDRDLVVGIGLEVYARHESPSLRNQLLAIKGFASTEAGAVVARSAEIEKLSNWARGLAKLNLQTKSNDKALQKSIQARILALNQADRYANRLIKTGDAWLQAIAFQAIANENLRLKEEILALPAPKGLKGPELKRYQVLVRKQVQPFYIKAVAVQAKVQGFWKTKPIDRYDAILKPTMDAKRQFLVSEGRKLVAALGAVGQKEAVQELNSALDADVSRIRLAEIERVKKSVKEDPFDVENIRQLRDLESKAGSQTMVAYLESRMSRMGVRP